MRIAAKRLAGDARVDQFYDPKDLTGAAIARALGASPGRSAWDIYLFYPPGELWESTPPAPSAWMHQLGWLSWSHHHSGKDLSRHLHQAAVALLGHY
ncbi:MAG: hypothetical protein ACRD04_03950 [Terriglobales bacterium]